jgi:very-short-patch-repair endonuclease
MYQYISLKQQAGLLSKELRKNQTPAEKIFWKHVQNKRFYGYKFLRQHPLFYEYWGSKRYFIADFYCSELRLIVEIDGGIHEKQQDYDRTRSEIIETQREYKVIRFKNNQVLKNINIVLRKLSLRIDL